ncbi:MAG: pilus assembly protein PilP [Holophagaceae bacterium]|nr:pilus assembly protein PilP [Holophagaceae bacterium]
MTPYLQKQIIIGGLAGVLVAVLTYILLGGTRTELKTLEASNVTLQEEVRKGYGIKSNYEQLKKEVDLQGKTLDALIKIMPAETDISEMPYRVKKMADTAGIDQVSFSNEAPTKPTEYYTVYPVQFEFRAGYHSFGEFASQVSGFEKIISISDIEMTRVPGRSLYPVTVKCKVKAYVYTPPPPPAPAAAAPAAGAGAKPAAKED